MKKKTKKLVLAKETVRMLESLRLNEARGGEKMPQEIGDTVWYRCFGSYGCPSYGGEC